MAVKYFEEGNFTPAFPTKDHYDYVFSVVKKFVSDPTAEHFPRHPYDFLYRHWQNWLKRKSNEADNDNEKECFMLMYEMLNVRDKRNPEAKNRYNKAHVEATFAELVRRTS